MESGLTYTFLVVKQVLPIKMATEDNGLVDETKYDSNDEMICNPGLIEDEYDEVGRDRIFSGFKLELKEQIGWDKDIKTQIPNESKVVLFIGETGAGKSTTLNTIQNHLEEVKYNDDFRWKLSLISQTSKSDTKNLTLYNANGYVFVDTPGFKDTFGKAKDIKTVDDIKTFLDSGLDYIDGICFVIKDSDNRLTASMKYVIDSVISLFAKDVIDHLFIIITSCTVFDKKVPNIISEHDILKNHTKELKRNIFRINNIPFIDVKQSNDSKDDNNSDNDSDSDSDSDNDNNIIDINESLFLNTNTQLKKFFKKIEAKKRVSIKLTTEVKRLKDKIKEHIDSLSVDIENILQHKALLYQLKIDGQKLVNPLTIITSTKTEQFDTPNLCYNNNTNRVTCHRNCKAWGKGFCCMLNYWGANCTQCGGKPSEHVLEKKYWKTYVDPKLTRAKKTNKTEMKSVEGILKDLENELYGKIGAIIIFGNEFNSIALKPIEYDIKTYIDDLIKQFKTKKIPKNVLKCFDNLKNNDAIKALNKYTQKIQQKGIKFADLEYDELKKHYKDIRKAVRDAVKK